MSQDLINKATAFATKAHEGQLRKGTLRPYIVHPIEVGDIVASITSDEEIIAAAILHDTIEDTDTTEEDIRREFGDRVASMVALESEDKSKTWFERKKHTIDMIPVEPLEVQIIALADKLSNIRDINRDYPVVGEELWNRFRMKDKEMIGWYYKGVRDSLEPRFKDCEAFKEYCRLIEVSFG
ncbi:MAG: HD domain-containing protein [Lachnospiraceae bacterium]|jgi:myo-inositol-1(or 4)-monophosphatase|nr:HD domain-containing protein [Lachnospiraceae bacterium]